MVYLSKKEAVRISKELAKIKNKDIGGILRKLNSSNKGKSYVKGRAEIRSLLKKAFDEKRKVKIRYYSPHSDEHTTRIIDIYQVSINSIVAFCHLREDERTFAIERINSAMLLDEKYKIPKGWSPESIILDK